MATESWRPEGKDKLPKVDVCRDWDGGFWDDRCIRLTRSAAVKVSFLALVERLCWDIGLSGSVCTGRLSSTRSSTMSCITLSIETKVAACPDACVSG